VADFPPADVALPADAAPPADAAECITVGVRPARPRLSASWSWVRGRAGTRWGGRRAGRSLAEGTAGHW
jgi:hypothetical protein